jgi:hypothetical protein
MARATLFMTALLTGAVVSAGCERGDRDVPPVAPVTKPATITWVPGRATKATESKRQGASEPVRNVSPTPRKEASEAPSSEPPPPPAARPPRPRAPHTDRCGRPLIT